MFARMAARAGLAAVVPLSGMAVKDWTATIGPVGNSIVSGMANASAHAGDSLVVQITIVGARAGDAHPWHLHTGGCDSAGAVLGEGGRYATLRVGPDERATASARVRVSLMPGSAYSVNVHRSPTDQAVIACGDLRPAPPHS